MRLLARSLVFVLPLLTGCLYSFTGGGLPRHIRSIAIVQFENVTPQPQIETDLDIELQQELPRNLNVRIAAEDAADAIVRGRIVSYDDQAINIEPSRRDEFISVQTRRIRITYEAEIYDLLEDRPLWRAQSATVTGEYNPESENEMEGMARAIEMLVERIIEGAQSQW